MRAARFAPFSLLAIAALFVAAGFRVAPSAPSDSPRAPALRVAAQHEWVPGPEALAPLPDGVACNSDGPTVGTPWVGEPGVTETVQQILDRDEASPPAKPIKAEFYNKARRGFPSDPNAPAVANWPPSDTPILGLDTPAPRAPQTVGFAFDTGNIFDAPAGIVPPDTMAAVGPTQVVSALNNRIKFFNKTTGALTFGTTLDSFFNSVRNGQFTTDPRAKYDRTSGRWFVICVNVPSSGANRVLIAVSNGSTITNTSSFTFYFFQQDTVAPAGNTGQFLDYPSLGVDANALYIGGNMFAASFVGTTGFVVRKSSVLSGGPIVVTAFRGLVSSASGPGPYAPQGVDNDDASATEGYFIGPDNQVFSRLVVRRVSTPGGTPTISGNLNITVPTTTFPINAPALGSTAPLDTLLDQLYNAVIHKNRLTGLSTLWCAHNITVNASGVGSSGGGRVGSRWYELQDLTTTPALRQSGTLFSSAASNPDSYYIPSVAMSGQGHMAIGTTVSGAARRAEIAVAGRLGTDTLGTIQAPATAITSTTNYNAETGVTDQRWGDYTHTQVDPNDDMTLWTVQQYCNATNSWATRIIQLLAPGPAAPTSCVPPTVSQGASNVNVTLNGTSSGGTGWFDPDASFPNHIAVAVNGGGVTVNSVTFVSPTQLTLNVTVSPSATPGARTITVTNPDGQAATSASGILTIPCPTITLSPPTLPNGQVGVFYSQNITAGGGNPPYNFTLSSGTLPPPLVLTPTGLLSGTPNTPGPFNFTVTATDADNCTGDRAYSVTIVPSCALLADMNVDTSKNGDDIQIFVNCLLTGGSPTGNCACGDMDSSGSVTPLDVPLFVLALLTP